MLLVIKRQRGEFLFAHICSVNSINIVPVYLFQPCTEVTMFIVTIR